MSENHTNETEHTLEEEVVDPIGVIYQGECLSLTGRSNIIFEIGKNIKDETLHFRILANSSAGMFNKQWISASILQDIFVGATDLNSRSFQKAYGQTSLNSAGFCLASLKHLGLIEVDPENARVHRHVARSTFAKVINDLIAEPKVINSKPVRKKAKEN